MTRRRVVGVMGSGVAPSRARAAELGRLLARRGVHLLTGGGQGAMAAVSEAFSETPGRQGLVIGVLPCDGDDPVRAKAGYPNRWVELAVRTHLPLSGTRGTEQDSRNHINVLTADVIVALPGGPGTASELALAVRYGRPAIAFVADAAEIEGMPEEIPVANDAAAVENFLDAHLGS